MLFIAASWLLWYYAVSGIGKLACKSGKFFPAAHAAGADSLEFFWLGLVSAAALGGLLQLFYPLNGAVLGIFLLTGLSGHLPNWNRARSLPLLLKHASFNRRIVSHSCALAAIAAVVSLPCLSFDETLAFSYDTGLYHLSVVRWINEYATAPGLANLHTRLGYGTASSFFTITALFDNWIWDGRSAWLINPFLLAVTLVQILRELLYGAGKSSALKIYSFACLMYLLIELLLLRPGLYFDSAVFYFLITAGLHVVKMAGEEAPFGLMPEKKPFSFYIVPSMTALAFTVKPMAAVVLLFCAAAYGALFLKRLRPVKASLPILAAAVIPSLLLLGYMSRNFVTSGWLFYPAPYGHISTEWSLSKEDAEREYNVIKFWTRAPGPNFMTEGNKPAREWTAAWLRRNLNFFNGATFFLPLSLAFVMAVWYLTLSRKRAFYVIALAALSASLAFWFLSGPDVRFARGMAWLMFAFSISALCGGGAIPASFNFSGFLSRRSAALAIAAVAAAAVLLCAFVLPRRHFDFYLWSMPRSAPRAVKPVTLDNGQTPPLVVWVPENAEDYQCGDAPLPCAPSADDRLRLFVPGDLSKGFYLKKD